MEKKSHPYRILFYYRPGLYLEDNDLEHLVQQIRETASTCFEETPPYQAMVGSREELADKVIAAAWRRDSQMAGFCSTVLLPVKGVLGRVLHLGLTCVRSEDRSAGLTHLLMKKVVTGYLLRHRPIGRVWVSNCAAVLSSLGNVALHFEKVFPSPVGKEKPSRKHVRIAQSIERLYREKLYIREDAVFDESRFVFRGSVRDTVFQKSANDRRYYHRNSLFNDYYSNLMNFDEGDEVLQVGYVSTLTTMKYAYRRRRLQRRLLLTEQASAA
jgi:hypothetical protein